MNRTNPDARDFNQVYSDLEDDLGDDVIKRWKARRIIVMVKHDNPDLIDTIQN